jgi:hypothetical protein
MSTLREAAQQTLEVCTDAVMGWQSLAPLSVRRAAMESLDALRDALAQEEQEPVAWTTKGQIKAMESGFQHYIQGRVPRFVSPSENDVALYTHPPRREWQGLMEEEIIKLAHDVLKKPANDSEPAAQQLAEGIARAVEQALKEKNA